MIKIEDERKESLNIVVGGGGGGFGASLDLTLIWTRPKQGVKAMGSGNLLRYG